MLQGEAFYVGNVYEFMLREFSNRAVIKELP